MASRIRAKLGGPYVKSETPLITFNTTWLRGRLCKLSYISYFNKSHINQVLFIHSNTPRGKGTRRVGGKVPSGLGENCPLARVKSAHWSGGKRPIARVNNANWRGGKVPNR